MPDYAVDDLWLGRPYGPARLCVEPESADRPDLVIEAAKAPTVRTGWTVMPGLVDHHVHLGLVDHTALADSAVVEVHDLGWAPSDALALRATPPAGLSVRIAGPFLTAIGGYPSGRSWAPAGAVREIASLADADQAVEVASRSAYDMIKVALNTDLPLLDDTVLTRLVARAHRADLRVVVHAEGPGQAARAVAAGADVLAHAPWTERLTDEMLRRAARQTIWLSTLAIHEPADRARATDNLRRFRSAGGVVRYGTDMGNGPTPVGVNGPEIRALGSAGLEGDALLAALTGTPVGPHAGSPPAQRLLASPHPLPVTAAEVVHWLADSRRLTAGALEELRVAP